MAARQTEIAKRFQPIHRAVIEQLFQRDIAAWAAVTPIGESYDPVHTNSIDALITEVEGMDGGRVEFFDQDCNFIGFILVVLDAGLEETVADLSSVGVVHDVYEEVIKEYHQ